MQEPNKTKKQTLNKFWLWLLLCEACELLEFPKYEDKPWSWAMSCSKWYKCTLVVVSVTDHNAKLVICHGLEKPGFWESNVESGKVPYKPIMTLTW